MRPIFILIFTAYSNCYVNNAQDGIAFDLVYLTSRENSNITIIGNVNHNRPPLYTQQILIKQNHFRLPAFAKKNRPFRRYNKRRRQQRKRKNWRSTSSVRQRLRSRFFDKLFLNYDKRIPPSNSSVSIEAAIFLNSLDSVSEISFDYDVGIFLRLKWEDPRLQFDPDDNFGDDSLTLTFLLYEKLWVPDLFVQNEKRAYFHNVVTPNRLIKLSSNGTLLYSSRLYLTPTCQMELHTFPFDSQWCDFQLLSYAYPMSKMNLNWAPTPLEMKPNLLVAQFTINSIEFENDITETPRGNYSTLTVTFNFIREMGFYMIQIYIPSLLTVLTAFTAFWIDPLAVPGRVTISVFTTLIMANMSFSFRRTLPTVSYIKAIDIWILACTIFVFLALVEYAFVNILLRQKPKIGLLATAKVSFAKLLEQQVNIGYMNRNMTPMTPLSGRDTSAGDAEDSEFISATQFFFPPRMDPISRVRAGLAEETMLEEVATDMLKQQMLKRSILYRIMHFLLPHPPGVPLDDLTGLERCNLLEAACRRLFPFSFVAFNCIYWSLYIHFYSLFSHGHDPVATDNTASRHAIDNLSL